MGVLIDEVFTEVSPPSGKIADGEDHQSEAANAQDAESGISLCDQIMHLQKRQLRLVAD